MSNEKEEGREEREKMTTMTAAEGENREREMPQSNATDGVVRVSESVSERNGPPTHWWSEEIG